MQRTAAVITVSDRSAAGERDDASGPVAVDALRAAGFACEDAAIVADGADSVEAGLRAALAAGARLIVTTGGTGPSPRDVTPEATEDVIEKPMPGFGELMRQVSLAKVPTAILSRQTAGIRGRCLIVNLPGRPRAIAECLDAVMPAIPYCIDLIEGPYLETDPAVIVAFRPGQKPKG